MSYLSERQKAKHATKYMLEEYLDDYRKNDLDRDAEISILEQRIEELKMNKEEDLQAVREKRILDLKPQRKRSMEKGPTNFREMFDRLDRTKSKRQKLLKNIKTQGWY